MKAIAQSMLKSLLRRRPIQNFAKSIVNKIAEAFSIDLLKLAYQKTGILNYKNEIESGEQYLVLNWLRLFLKTHGINQPYFFDVGANQGKYSSTLLSLYPLARVFAFEPNPHTFGQLKELSQANPNLFTFNTAVGSTIGEMKLYYRTDNTSSVHATTYKEVLTEIHGYTDVQKLSVMVNTLDAFCYQNNIDHIDLLKIDTEGHEIQVLRGAENILKTGIVKCVQFEFNEMNIHSRVFLRDFVQVLPDFNLYRLLPTSLLPIQYASRHEIFLFQNFLAVRKDLDLVQ
jgi:FkbM family methyltransferase